MYFIFWIKYDLRINLWSIKIEIKESNIWCEYLLWMWIEESIVKYGYSIMNWVWNYKDVMIIVSNGYRKWMFCEKKKWK